MIIQGQVQWQKPVILPTWEAEIGKITVQDRPVGRKFTRPI
jgi:hypothetical protein